MKTLELTSQLVKNIFEMWDSLVLNISFPDEVAYENIHRYVRCGSTISEDSASCPPSPVSHDPTALVI